MLMKIDYHTHFEYGDYDENWAEGFFDAAKARGIDEIGITEHTHTFPEFYDLYRADVTTDDTSIGLFQREWLKKNKFKHSLDDYFRFMEKLKKKHKVKIGLEVCNFRDQDKVYRILRRYRFDYLIVSVHFLHGWGFDASALAQHFDEIDPAELYAIYADAAVELCRTKMYDVLGHPFNLNLFGHLPQTSVTDDLKRTVEAMEAADMIVDVNTGSSYRYPVGEIMPGAEFLRLAAAHNLSVITSSDAHDPADCGRAVDEAIAYAKDCGMSRLVTFEGRKKIYHAL